MARIEDAFNLVAALVTFIMMSFMVAEVVGRKVFHAPIPGAIDWIEVSMAAFAFLGAAYCQRLRGNIRMALVTSKFQDRSLWSWEARCTALAVFYIIGSGRES